MATVTLSEPIYYFAGVALASRVVGYESNTNRVARYAFTAPASGATTVSLSFAGATWGEGTQKPLRFYIGTSDSDHANAGASSSYTGELSYSGDTWSGTATVLLQPSTTYYLWVFPGTTTYGWWYWYTATASMTTNGGLKTTISASDGTLNSTHTINLTRYSTDFKHKLTATCGTSTVTIAEAAQSASVTWTPPLDWCNQNTSSVYVSVTISCETFSGSTSCGTSEVTVTMVMPDSVKPTISALTVSDPKGYASTYSGYVQTKSQVEASATAEKSYGATIKSTVITIDGVASDSNTWALSTRGTKTVKATVTDSRRTATATTTITVLAYSAPSATITSAYRCDSSGTAQTDGAYIKITWSAAITSLNAKNTSAYTLKYRVSGASTWSSVTLSDQAGSYSVSGATKIISASTDSVFELCVTAKDAFSTATSMYRTVASAGAIIDLYKDTNDLHIRARTTFYGATNMTKWVLLWSNESATSTFASQSITLGLSDYGLYVVIARHSTSIAGAVTVINKVGNSSRLSTIGASSSYSETIRTVSSTSTALTFGNATKNGSTDNSFLIPILIYGIKGVG